MKKLVISWRSYDWIYHCAGIIMREPANFDVIVVCSDDDIPILELPKLCEGAIYVQRAYDLSKIGKELGVRKLMNLRYEPDCINIERLIMELQLYISMSGIKEIYYYGNTLLNRILIKMNDKFKLSLFAYSDIKSDGIRLIKLTEEEIKRKNRLQGLIIGSDRTSDELECLLSRKYEIFEEVL